MQSSTHPSPTHPAGNPHATRTPDAATIGRPLPVRLPAAFAMVTLVILVAAAGCVPRSSFVEIADGRSSFAPGPDGSDPGNPAPAALPSALSDLLSVAEAHARSMDREVEAPPRPLSSVSGAFTQAGADERLVLYLVSVWPRCCPLVGLALFRDGLPVRHTVFEGAHQTLVPFPGGGSGGRDAVFLSGAFGQGGSNSGSLTLLEFDGEAWREAGSTALYEGNCETGSPGASETAYRILADARGRLVREAFRSDCTEVWESLGPWEAVELEVAGWREPTAFTALGLGR